MIHLNEKINTLIRAATGGKIIAKIDKRRLPRRSPMINEINEL